MAEGKGAGAKFALMLPVEVKIVESYVTWMEELAKHVEVSSVNKADSLADYIKLILEDEKQNQLSEDGKITCGEVSAVGDKSTDNEDDDSDWSDSIGFIAMKLNVAAMYTYLEDYTSAMAHLKFTEKEYLDKLGLQECHREVIEYFRDSLSWSIGVLKGFKMAKDGSDLNIVIKGSAKLNSKWEDLENGDDKVKATLAFTKACLSAAMKVSEKATLDLLLEATKLDPQCHFWYHYAFRIMRRIRRNVKRSNGANLPPPSVEETRLAKAEHDLVPDDVVAVADYALVLKEKIWMRHEAVWKENEDGYLKCVELFEKALALAVEKGNKKWTRKIKIYLAEFLAFGKGEKLNKERGRQLFEESELEYPTSTFVLHKVGKLYHHGIHYFGGDRVGKGVDLKKAQDCYKRAIESNPGNFACLMDYVKLQQRLHDYVELIDLIEKSLEHYKRDYQVSKLKIIHGYITWVHNPRDLPDPKAVAVEEWLFVLEELPEFSRQVYDAIKSPMFRDPEISAQMVKVDVMQYLEGMKRDCGNVAKSELIEHFIEELAKPSFRERRMQGGGPARGTGRGGARMPRRNYENGDGDGQVGGDNLTDQMKGLTVSSRPNRQSQRSTTEGEEGQGNWRKKQEGNGSGNENSGFGKARPQRYSDADEDQAWRKKE